MWFDVILSAFEKISHHQLIAENLVSCGKMLNFFCFQLIAGIFDQAKLVAF